MDAAKMNNYKSYNNIYKGEWENWHNKIGGKIKCPLCDQYNLTNEYNLIKHFNSRFNSKNTLEFNENVCDLIYQLGFLNFLKYDFFKKFISEYFLKDIDECLFHIHIYQKLKKIYLVYLKILLKVIIF